MLLYWQKDPDPDAEYRQEYATTPKGTRVTVFSDRDGTEWAYQVGDAEPVFGAESQEDARRDAAYAAEESDA